MAGLKIKMGEFEAKVRGRVGRGGVRGKMERGECERVKGV